MAKKIVFNKEQIEECIKLYTIDKWGLSRIGEHIGRFSKGTIKRILMENNITIDTPGQRYNGGKSIARKRWVEKNRDHRREYEKKWLEKNSEHRKQYMKEYREKNKDKINETKRIYEKNRKDSDPHYKLACYTRTAVCTCLKENNINKYKSTFDLLPFKLEGLIEHLESQFNDGMCWDNYGDWHLDHIKPMSSFNFGNVGEFTKCWSLDNLQPLWGVDNLIKGSKVL